MLAGVYRDAVVPAKSIAHQKATCTVDDTMRYEKLHGLWHEQRGLCCYCEGPTFLANREAKEAARDRLHVVAGTSGAGKRLNQHVATIDAAAKMMACKFCNCCRGNRSVPAHGRAMRALVAAELHPVNRLVETYELNRLSWLPLSAALLASSATAVGQSAA